MKDKYQDIYESMEKLDEVISGPLATIIFINGNLKGIKIPNSGFPNGMKVWDTFKPWGVSGSAKIIEIYNKPKPMTEAYDEEA